MSEFLPTLGNDKSLTLLNLILKYLFLAFGKDQLSLQGASSTHIIYIYILYSEYFGI